MREAAEIGTVVPFERNAPVVREDYTKAIQLWCQTRDTAAALSREEIGALGRMDRIDAQRKAIILALAHYYRKHERSDVAPGVAVVLTLLSDNEKGAATISQPTLAKLFGRSRSAIAEAQAKLRDDGIIVTSRGRYAATYPVIPRAVTTSYNHMTWLIDAVCTQDASVNRLTGQDDYQSSDGTLRLDQSLGGTLPLKQFNRSVEDGSIVRPDPTQLQSKTSKEDTTLEGARDARSLTRAVALGIAAASASLPAAAVPREPVAIVQAARTQISSKELSDKLFEAGGAALSRVSGLEVMSTPIGWLDNGCDLEADILPIVRARAAKKPPQSINSWIFFSQAISDAKAARLTPLPPQRPPQARLAPWEEEALRVKLEADAVSEQYKAEYRRKMEQSRG